MPVGPCQMGRRREREMGEIVRQKDRTIYRLRRSLADRDASIAGLQQDLDRQGDRIADLERQLNQRGDRRVIEEPVRLPRGRAR